MDNYSYTRAKNKKRVKRQFTFSLHLTESKLSSANGVFLGFTPNVNRTYQCVANNYLSAQIIGSVRLKSGVNETGAGGNNPGTLAGKKVSSVQRSTPAFKSIAKDPSL